MTEIPHLTLGDEKAKNRLSFPPVLATDKTSTNHQIQTHSCWGHTFKKSSTSLITWIPQCTNFPGCLVKHQSVHTAVPNSSVAGPALQHSRVHQVLFVIWILSQEHGSSSKQESLCVHNTLSYYFWPPSGLLLCLPGAQQLDWQQASPHSWHLPPSQCMSRQELRMLLLH